MTYNNEPKKDDEMKLQENESGSLKEDVNNLNEPDKTKNDSTPTLKKRTCPYCKQEVHMKVGVGNWKNLFRKPTTEDWISLIILILIILAAFAYTTETKQCKDTLSNLDRVCLDYNKMISNSTRTETSINVVLPINFTPYNLTTNVTNDSYVPYIPNGYENESVNSSINDSNSSGLIGGEKDEHGCVIPAGYSWCESKQKCLRTWEENCTIAVSGSKVNVSVTVANHTNANQTI